MLVMDLFQNVVAMAARSGLTPTAKLSAQALPPACSTLMVWGRASADGALRHARNFDFPGIGLWDRAPCVVFCEPDQGLRYGFLSTRGADAPGITCFNEAGISVTMHTRFHRSVAFSGAGVVDLGHEIVRSASSLEEAIEIACRQPTMSTWGIAISSARANPSAS